MKWAPRALPRRGREPPHRRAVRFITVMAHHHLRDHPGTGAAAKPPVNCSPSKKSGNSAKSTQARSAPVSRSSRILFNQRCPQNEFFAFEAGRARTRASRRNHGWDTPLEYLDPRLHHKISEVVERLLRNEPQELPEEPVEPSQELDDYEVVVTTDASALGWAAVIVVVSTGQCILLQRRRRMRRRSRRSMRW